MSIRIGIYGYGNLGRGVENAIRQNPDMTLRAVFTRRDPSTLHIQTPTAEVLHVDRAPEMVNEIDVMMMHGMQPVFISCKNGSVETEELYKLLKTARRKRTE